MPYRNCGLQRSVRSPCDVSTPLVSPLVHNSQHSLRTRSKHDPQTLCKALYILQCGKVLYSKSPQENRRRARLTQLEGLLPGSSNIDTSSVVTDPASLVPRSIQEFKDIGCAVVGCSVDNVFSHLAWISQSRKEVGAPIICSLLEGL